MDAATHCVHGFTARRTNSPESTHLNMLQEVVGRRSFNGFPAKLTDNERQKLACMDGVVSVFPSRTLHLQTTRSWDFMGFNESVTRKRNIESNIIVGVIDTGIWPESDSFSDEGFGTPPKKWKGACRGGKNFTCNKLPYIKIIGARYYNSSTPGNSTRDEEGHGSRTASTAAGNQVKDTSFYGLVKGTARGGVPCRTLQLQTTRSWDFMGFNESVSRSKTFLLLCMNILYGAADTDTDRKLHIVYMGSLPEGQYSPESTHLNMLQEVVGRSSLENILVRSYRRSFNGFAAKLTDNERQKLASMDGVVSVFPSRTLHLQTTRSWDFMGFNESVTRKRNIESDIIVGVIDTGIWPESDSFSDEGFGAPPKKWKGACRGGKNFTCNNKIIGARYYNSSTSGDSTRDEEGHGSHTASTAADNGCGDADILAAFDDAIADGVDLITISIGAHSAIEFNEDPIAIGAFHAMAKGILTVNSAGNDGPYFSSVSSVAPWLFTVAASSTDRLIVDNIILGDGKTVQGSSINSFSLDGRKLPLVLGKEVLSSNCPKENAEACIVGCLDSRKVKGKIIICDTVSGYQGALGAGAAGSILQTILSKEDAFIFPFPASAVSSEEYNAILSYKNSTRNPQAEILKSEAIKNSTAPVVTKFSSRGPNSLVPEILKPDITAPGLQILAAYSPIASDSFDKRSFKYKILSGTSMACPHVSGVAAYVKTFHPD
ncbi:hypothetical protein Q3G72_022858 [Acer saccharum]|nr:hypothetical protein Q3G72_022858 [Acer saccharum]